MEQSPTPKKVEVKTEETPPSFEEKVKCPHCDKEFYVRVDYNKDNN